MISIKDYINLCLKRTGKLQKNLAAALDMSPSQLSHQLAANRILLDQYITAMEFFGIDPREYFDENASLSVHTGDISNTALLGMASVSFGSPGESYLRQSIIDKDAIIAEKERVIKLQADLIEHYKNLTNASSTIQ